VDGRVGRESQPSVGIYFAAFASRRKSAVPTRAKREAGGSGGIYAPELPLRYRAALAAGTCSSPRNGPRLKALYFSIPFRGMNAPAPSLLNAYARWAFAHKLENARA